MWHRPRVCGGLEASREHVGAKSDEGGWQSRNLFGTVVPNILPPTGYGTVDEAIPVCVLVLKFVGPDF